MRGCRPAGIAKPEGADRRDRADRLRAASTTSAKNRKALLHDVAPLLFLRETLCLNAKYRKSGSCTPLTAAGYAHHAYTTAAGPLYKPPERDNVTIGVLSRLSRALDLAAARARRSPSRLPIYLTEFGVQSKPNRFLGVSVAQQAEFDAIAEQIAWSNARVAAFSQYLLVDDPLGGKPGLERQRRHDRLPDGPRVPQRQAQAAVLRLARAADRLQARPRLLAVGARAPDRRARRR